MRCLFAHRTKKTSHHPVAEVAEAAGVVTSRGEFTSQVVGLSAESSWMAEMAESSSRVGQLGQMPLLYRMRRVSERGVPGRDIEEVALLPGEIPGSISRISVEGDSHLRHPGVILEQEIESLEIWEDPGVGNIPV